ncbi:MAG TPA: sulfite exporter TauE/SafE family protein [Geminicoccaceae bacterium]|nr:sulfite exporter TauE/SafE family protein [Geminicoccaceae bacterium]
MDLAQFLIVAAAFALGGAVKGVVGLGLPTVALAVLGTGLGPSEALPLLVAPAFLTNVWQATAGGRLASLLRRFWPLLLAGVPGAVLGTAIFVRAEPALLDTLLGAVLCAYAVSSLSGRSLAVPGGRERALGPVVGFGTGVVAGTTGTLVLPVVPYLTGLGLERDELVQAMGISFALSSFTLGAALSAQGALGFERLAASILAVLPAAAGMLAGQRIRQRIPPQRFRQGLFLCLLALGANLIWRGLAAPL